ncbi:hypothetical protein [uncultured Kocuria sp.]|uniref:hypothetical protein n=1 Tax=uncultured Kocuria sp. TaxID=259305 RepID=UPI0026284060|nr:hypothetical protein [uncultured Kocuria sp.]
MSKYEDNVQRVIKLMKDAFDTDFKEYYDGDPEDIPLFNLPAIIVTQTRDDTVEGAYAQDDVTEEIVIKVVLNKKDDFDNDKADPLNMTERKIREYVGRRDPETGEYGEKTVKGVLRRFGTEGIVAVAPRVSVEYGIVPRMNNLLTSEGHVTFTITYTVDVDDFAV